MAHILQNSGSKHDFIPIEGADPTDLSVMLHTAEELVLQWDEGAQSFTIQTSGSTGSPKPIVLSREKIVYSAQQTAAAFGLTQGDTLLCCLGLNYIAGFMMLMRGLVLDAHVILDIPSSNPLERLPERQKIDFASFVPMQMAAMLDDASAIKTMNGMKAILVGGGPVSKALEDSIQVLQVPVYHTYSMTETYTHVAVRRMNGPGKSNYYQPMPGTILSKDERGCLVIQSFLTDNKPLITNDLVDLQPNGSFEWIGRIDNVIISGGVKIQLEKIEAMSAEVLNDMGISIDFFAAGIPDEKLGEKLVLVIAGEKWGQKITIDFYDQLSGLLTKYEIPKDILFVQELSKTLTGKLDRRATLKKL